MVALATTSAAIIFTLIFVIGWVVYAFMNRGAGRAEIGSEIELAANRKKYYEDEELEGKRLDMIVANLVGARLGFDEDDNSAMVLWRNGAEELSRMSKVELARQIIHTVATRYRASRAPRVVSFGN